MGDRDDNAGATYRAVLNAAEVALLVRESFPEAFQLRFTVPPLLVGAAPLLVRVADTFGQVVWAHDGVATGQWDRDWAERGKLARQDAIRQRLADAWDADPGVFVRSQRPEVPWESLLHFPEVLDRNDDYAAMRLGDHAEFDLDVDIVALAHLMHDVAHEEAKRILDGKDWSPLPEQAVHELLHDRAGALAAEANSHGLHDQMRFLLGHLGERDAWVALENI